MNTGNRYIRKEYAPERLAALLAAAPAGWPYGERVRRLCAALAGAPYRRAPLGGGPGQPEAFTAALDAFLDALSAWQRDPSADGAAAFGPPRRDRNWEPT